jgi:hypothetical protein
MQAARAMVAEMVTLYISALIESGYSKQIANELAFRRGLLACMPNVPHMPLVNDGETHWYNAECESCGWYGSSQYLDGGGQIADTGDYNDCYCPWCGSTAIEDYCPPTKTGE